MSNEDNCCSVELSLSESPIVMLDALGDSYIGELPTMSTVQKGGAKVGAGLEVDSDEYLNIAPSGVVSSMIDNAAIATEKLADGAVTAEKIDPDVLDNLGATIAYSGSGESVTADNASYLAGLTVDGKAVQDGTPTPSNPVDVKVASLYWNQLFQSLVTTTNDGITTSYDSTTHLISITNNSRTANYGSGSTRANIVDVSSVDIGHKYYIGGSFVLGVGVVPSGATSFTAIGDIYTANSEVAIALRITNQYDFISAHPIGSTTTLHMFVVDLTEMFGAGNEPTAEQFKAMYPETYYPYDAGSTQILLQTGTSYTPIDLNGNVLASLPDGTKDVLTVDSVGHCVLEKRTGARTFNGSESWTLENNGNRVATYLGAGSIKPTSSATEVPSMICSHFEPINRNSSWAGTQGVSQDANGTSIYFSTGETLTVNGWKTWLASNPVTLVYPLATPTEIDLGYISMPAIPDGSTISITAQVTPTISASWWARGAAAIAEALQAVRARLQAIEAAIAELATA